MIVKIRLGSWRFTFSLNRITDVVGVNSECKDGKHILMWDFDDVAHGDVQRTLYLLQRIYNLPNIYILNTGQKHHYMAYCFKKFDFLTALSIVSGTPYIDPTFVRMSAFRKRFTLRVSDKEGRSIRPVTVLKSPIKDEATVRDLKSFVKYETCTDHWINDIFLKAGDVEVWQ